MKKNHMHVTRGEGGNVSPEDVELPLKPPDCLIIVGISSDSEDYQLSCHMEGGCGQNWPGCPLAYGTVVEIGGKAWFLMRASL